MRYIYTLLLLTIANSFSWAQSENAIYIYLNNGDFNAVFCDEIDSILQSKVDTLGIIHDDWQSQVIYTKDSIYRYQLSLIDSISFHAPETIYKSDVVFMSDQWKPYVTIVDTLTISVLHNSLGLQAKIGDVLMTDMSNNNPEECFVGRVSEIKEGTNDTEYVCDAVDIEDIYQQFVTIERINVIPVQGSGQARKRGAENPLSKRTYEIPTAHYTLELDENMDLHGDYTPTLEVDCVVKCVNGNKVIRTRSVNTSVLNLGFSICADRKTIPTAKSNKITFFELYIPYTPICIFLDACLFLELDAKISGGIDFGYTFSSVDESIVVNNKPVEPIHTSNCVFETPKVNLSVDGNVFGGSIFYLGVGVGFPKRVLGTGVATKVGFTLSGNGAIISPLDEDPGIAGYRVQSGNSITVLDDNYSTIAYELLKNSKFTIGTKEEFAGFADFLKKDIDLPTMSIAYEQELFSRYIVPEFSEVKSEIRGNDILVNAHVSRDLFTMAKVGIGVFDNNRKPVGDIIYYDYNGINELQIAQKYQISDNGRYTICPVVKLKKPLSDDYFPLMCALPNYRLEVLNVCPDNNHPHKIDLGLPSETKWSCCDLGAESPQTTTDFCYAYAETETKNLYSMLNYKYVTIYDEDPGVEDAYFLNNIKKWVVEKDIIDNIAGTSYDAAHVNWGGSWQMPTTAQFEELLQKCRWEKRTLNYVYCFLLTGPNGNKLLLFPNKSQVDDQVQNSYMWWTSTGASVSIYGNNDYNVSPIRGKGINAGVSIGRSIRPVSN